MAQMSFALVVFIICGLWYADRYIVKLQKGDSGTLVNGRIYAASLVIGLVLALFWL